MWHPCPAIFDVRSDLLLLPFLTHPKLRALRVFTRAEARSATGKKDEGYVGTADLVGVGIVVDLRPSRRTRQRGVLTLQLVQRARYLQHGNQNVSSLQLLSLARTPVIESLRPKQCSSSVE